MIWHTNNKKLYLQNNMSHDVVSLHKITHNFKNVQNSKSLISKYLNRNFKHVVHHLKEYRKCFFFFLYLKFCGILHGLKMAVKNSISEVCFIIFLIEIGVLSSRKKRYLSSQN